MDTLGQARYFVLHKVVHHEDGSTSKMTGYADITNPKQLAGLAALGYVEVSRKEYWLYRLFGILPEAVKEGGK